MKRFYYTRKVGLAKSGYIDINQPIVKFKQEELSSLCINYEVFRNLIASWNEVLNSNYFYFETQAQIKANSVSEDINFEFVEEYSKTNVGIAYIDAHTHIYLKEIKNASI